MFTCSDSLLISINAFSSHTEQEQSQYFIDLNMQIDLNGKTYKQIFVDTEKKFGNFSLQLEPPLKVLQYDKSIDLVAHQRIYVGGGGGGVAGGADAISSGIRPPADPKSPPFVLF